MLQLTDPFGEPEPDAERHLTGGYPEWARRPASQDATRGRSAGTVTNPLHDPTRGRSAGTVINPLRDPTRGRSA